MQNSSLIKLFTVLTVMIFVTVAVLNFWKLNAPEMAKVTPTSAKAPDYSASYKPPVPKAVRPKPETEPNFDDAESPLPRDKVEAWLAKHNRSATSLLAAFRAMGDTNYLNEAATNFPNNPQVEWTVLARNAFPEERRKWLDLFKASSPSNSLANYLSAEDHFKNGKSQDAVSELLAASGKPDFDGHATESRLDEEDLFLASGKSPLEASEAALAGICGDMLPQLATLKQLDQAMADLQKQQINAGDNDSAINLAQMGMALGNQLNSGDSGKYLINQLVGISTEVIALSQLDKNTSYEFLGGQTPVEVIQQLRDQKKSYSEMARQFSAAYPNMTEDEMTSYLQRSKIYGETEAEKWVIQQYPATNPAK